MPNFNYARPTNISHLKEVLEQNQPSTMVAGGTDFMVQFRMGKINPDFVVDLTGVEELKNIINNDEAITIGSMVTHSEIASSDLIKEKATALTEASSLVGSPQIRNTGTIGGNMGTASPAGDTLPAILALGAKINIMGPDGECEVKSEEFFIRPGKTVLKSGEFIASLSFEDIKGVYGSAFVKQGKRNALAISVVNSAVWVKIDKTSRKILEARIAVGSVAPTPIRVNVAEQYLIGKVLTEEVKAEVERLVSENVKPIDDVRSTAKYRKETAGVIAKRALMAAYDRAE